MPTRNPLAVLPTPELPELPLRRRTTFREPAPRSEPLESRTEPSESDPEPSAEPRLEPGSEPLPEQVSTEPSDPLDANTPSPGGGPRHRAEPIGNRRERHAGS